MQVKSCEEDFGLTPIEREILVAICDGLKDEEIASAMRLSGQSIDLYRESLLNRLGVRDRLELMLFAFINGIAKPPGPFNQETSDDAG
jgi:DNA-binding NarL/FixJ family response regulator